MAVWASAARLPVSDARPLWPLWRLGHPRDGGVRHVVAANSGGRERRRALRAGRARAAVSRRRGRCFCRFFRCRRRRRRLCRHRRRSRRRRRRHFCRGHRGGSVLPRRAPKRRRTVSAAAAIGGAPTSRLPPGAGAPPPVAPPPPTAWGPAGDGGRPPCGPPPAALVPASGRPASDGVVGPPFHVCACERLLAFRRVAAGAAASRTHHPPGSDGRYAGTAPQVRARSTRSCATPDANGPVLAEPTQQPRVLQGARAPRR